MPGIFGRPSALPFFCEAKGDYYRAALLQKNRAFEEGVLWRCLFASVSPTVGRKAEKNPFIIVFAYNRLNAKVSKFHSFTAF